jgi:uncharacterized protein (TIGR00645 family)
MNQIEVFVERLLIGARWLQAPLYVGLIGTLIILAVKFFHELVHITAVAWSAEESDIVLSVLTLVDIVLVANLIVMVMISGYENFVSRMDEAGASEKLSWFGKLDHGSIKIKLASSIVSISAIHLLKAFLDASHVPNDKLLIMIAIHLTFVVSAVLLALIDRMTPKH